MSSLLSTAALVVPVFCVIALGWVAGRRGTFTGERRTALNQLVLGFALPAALFAGTVGTSRSTLAQDLALFGLLVAGLFGLQLVALAVLRFLVRLPLSTSALLALACAQPQFAFMGIPILQGVIGADAAQVPIAAAGIIVNVLMVPVTLVLLDTAAAGTGSQESDGTRATRRSTVIAAAGRSSVRQPIVWAPLLAFVLVLLAVPVPAVLTDATTFLGAGASGLALLSVGVTVARIGKIHLRARVFAIAAASLVMQPLLVLALGTVLGTASQVVTAAALTVAFPISPVALLLAQRHHAEEEADIASALVISVFASVLTLAALVVLRS